MALPCTLVDNGPCIHIVPQPEQMGAALQHRHNRPLRATWVLYVSPAGHQCVHTVSELKKGAIIGDFELLTSNLQDMYMDLQRDTYSMTR
jgi:hypothetical protein